MESRMLSYEQRDYNEILADISAQRSPENHFDEIAAIPNLRDRSICVMLMVGVPTNDIAHLLRISRPHLYRIVKVMTGKQRWPVHRVKENKST